MRLANRRGTNWIESYWRSLKLMTYRTYCTLGNEDSVEALLLEANWRINNSEKNMQDEILDMMEFVSRERLIEDSLDEE